MTDKLKHFGNNIEAEFWNENKKFLVQDLALSAMVSFLKHGSVSSNNVLSQFFIFSLFFDTIFFYANSSLFRWLSLSNTNGRTDDINENRQHLGLDILRNEQMNSVSQGWRSKIKSPQPQSKVSGSNIISLVFLRYLVMKQLL